MLDQSNRKMRCFQAYFTLFENDFLYGIFKLLTGFSDHSHSVVGSKVLSYGLPLLYTHYYRMHFFYSFYRLFYPRLSSLSIVPSSLKRGCDR